MKYDDPQLWSVKEFLVSERDALVDYLEELGQNDEDNVSEIVMIKHVVDYLDLRISGHYK